MADETEPAAEGESATAGGDDLEGRTTAPMSEFPAGHAGIGFVVLLVGVVVAFVLPLALAI